MLVRNNGDETSSFLCERKHSRWTTTTISYPLTTHLYRGAHTHRTRCSIPYSDDANKSEQQAEPNRPNRMRTKNADAIKNTIAVSSKYGIRANHRRDYATEREQWMIRRGENRHWEITRANKVCCSEFYIVTCSFGSVWTGSVSFVLSLLFSSGFFIYAHLLFRCKLLHVRMAASGVTESADWLLSIESIQWMQAAAAAAPV